MTRQVLSLAALLALAVVVGCGGGGHKVEGEVTLDGKPVEEALVTFLPDGTGEQAFGVTDSGGKFTLRTAKQKGAPPGNYKVTVTKTDKGQAFQKEGKVAPGTGGSDYVKAMTGGKGVGTTPSGSKSLLPEKYATPKTTPLTATVPTSGSMKLELTSK